MSTIKTDNLTSTDGLKTIDVSALIDEVALLRSDLTTAEAQIVTNTGNIVSISDPGIATAWVKFSGIDGSIAGSTHNVSTVVRTSTGDYTVTFTTVMDNVDYVVSGVSMHAGGVTGDVHINAVTTSTVEVNVASAAGDDVDRTYVYIAIHGGKN